jgi:hypothetical protein
MIDGFCICKFDIVLVDERRTEPDIAFQDLWDHRMHVEAFHT